MFAGPSPCDAPITCNNPAAPECRFFAHGSPRLSQYRIRSIRSTSQSVQRLTDSRQQASDSARVRTQPHALQSPRGETGAWAATVRLTPLDALTWLTGASVVVVGAALVDVTAGAVVVETDTAGAGARGASVIQAPKKPISTMSPNARNAGTPRRYSRGVTPSQAECLLLLAAARREDHQVL